MSLSKNLVLESARQAAAASSGSILAETMQKLVHAGRTSGVSTAIHAVSVHKHVLA